MHRIAFTILLITTAIFLVGPLAITAINESQKHSLAENVLK